MSIEISKRRIQRLGGSSLIITIPKTWARKIGLGVGDEVIVVDEGDHLKVLPPNAKLVKTLGAVSVKLASYVKNIDVGRLAECAYTRGFDRLIIELPRSNGVRASDVLRRLEESGYVQEAVEVMGIIEAELVTGETVTPKHLKVMGGLLANLLEEAARGTLSSEQSEDLLSKAESILNQLIRNAYKHKVLTCSGENLDPMVLGGLKTLIPSIRLLAESLSRTPGGEAEAIAKTVSKALTDVMGGIANMSGKRLSEAVKSTREAAEHVTGHETAALAKAILTQLSAIAEVSLCPNLLRD